MTEASPNLSSTETSLKTLDKVLDKYVDGKQLYDGIIAQLPKRKLKKKAGKKYSTAKGILQQLAVDSLEEVLVFYLKDLDHANSNIAYVKDPDSSFSIEKQSFRVAKRRAMK